MKSMTGFGRGGSRLSDGTEITVQARSVNHRFLDVAVKLRDELAALEPELRRLVADRATRGRVDLTVRVARPGGRTASFDEEAAARYAALWREAASRRGLPAELGARDLLSLPGVLRSEEDVDQADALREGVLKAAGAALHELDAARSREGEALSRALSALVDRLEAGIGRLDESREGLAARVVETLRERVAKLAGTVPLDEGRLAQEVALLADRADVTEEIDRLKAHLSEVRRLLASAGPVGKRLDFLAQELHREVNTSGQKARELSLTRAVLDLKSDVEAFKEQVQNVE